MYSGVKLVLTKQQQKRLIQGKTVRVNKNNQDGAQIVMLHPMNAKKVSQSKNGCNLSMSPGEIMATAQFHKLLPENLDQGKLTGAGILDSIWSGIKQVGSFLKDTGIASKIADVAQETVAPVIGDRLAKGLREGLRGATGVGLKSAKKGSKKNIKIKGTGLYL